jgi:SAM-dependent methyltransferase
MTPPDDPTHIETQRARFDQQASDYSSHHSNPLAQEYRDRFIRPHLFDSSLEGRRVLDAMCGSGEETGFLLSAGAVVQGLDLSSAFATKYEDQWDLSCKTASITDTGFDDSSFDIVYICGGLHHIRPQLSETIDEVERILKPGGEFAFVEPNHDSWSDAIRRAWYRVDRRFGNDEAAISVDDDLKELFSDRFEEISIHQGGNLAYLLVAQSFIVRTPRRFQEKTAGLLFRLEKLIHGTPLDPRFFVCGRFQKVEQT